MSPKSHYQNIEEAIACYAQAYAVLEKLQKNEGEKEPHKALLPKKGDQKTGLIGEYWAVRYARSLFKGATVIFGGHSQKGWDLKVQESGKSPRYIQVKTVSDFGQGKLSPIFNPSPRAATAVDETKPSEYWNELWLLSLDKEFQPSVLWKLKPEHIEFDGRDRIKGKLLRRNPNERTTGSGCFKWEQAESVIDIREKLKSG